MAMEVTKTLLIMAAPGGKDAFEERKGGGSGTQNFVYQSLA